MKKIEESTFTCKNCGVTFNRTVYKGTSPPRFCDRYCYADFQKKQTAEKSKNFKGGFYETGGYYMLRIGRENVPLHRVIMGNYIGRKLRDKEVVHHCNQNKKDNRIENLVIMAKSDHGSLHSYLKKFNDGVSFAHAFDNLNTPKFYKDNGCLYLTITKQEN